VCPAQWRWTRQTVLNTRTSVDEMALDRTTLRLYTLDVTSADVIRALKSDGWKLVRVAGSHHHFAHPTKPNLVTVPHPKKDIPIGTLRSIERQAEIKIR
jgi:predicted RNA binding protein YcfA (HicA-like mRNA interferase family)